MAQAHASCFFMALSAKLDNVGLTAKNIHTDCAVKPEKTDAGWTVTTSHLQGGAKVPGAGRATFGVAAAGVQAAERENHQGGRVGGRFSAFCARWIALTPRL